MHKTFRYSKLSDAQKGSSTKSWDSVRHNIFDKKLRYRPLFSLIFLIPESFKNANGFPHESLRFVPVRPKVFDKTVMPSLLCMIICDTQNPLKQ